MKKYIIILFLGLLGLSWYSAVSDAVNDPKELEAHLEKAEELENKGIYVDAVTEYEAALEYAPERTDIHLKLANVYYLSGNTRQFINICEERAEDDQDSSEPLDLLMEYYIDNNNYTDALQYLQEFCNKYPENETSRKWFLELEGSYEEMYCRYDIESDILNASMSVSADGLYGIADDQGKELIECMYLQSYPFSADGFALVQREDGSYIFIDADGQTRKVPDSEYEDFGMFESGRVQARKNGKYGYLNEDMEAIGSFDWDELTGFRNGVGAGRKGEEWFLLDDEEKIVSDEYYEDIIIDEAGFCSSQERIFVKKGGKYILVDTKGKAVGNLSFDLAKSFTDNGFAAVCNDGKWGFINSDGELIIDYAFEDADSFQNGFAAVCQDDLWGYIDEEGYMAIEPQFTEAGHFSSSGTAVVSERSQEEDVRKIIKLYVFE